LGLAQRERRLNHPQRAQPLSLFRFHRRDNVLIDLLYDCHFHFSCSACRYSVKPSWRFFSCLAPRASQPAQSSSILSGLAHKILLISPTLTAAAIKSTRADSSREITIRS